MNPVIFSLGPLSVRVFTAWVALGCFVCAGVVLYGARRRGERLIPWLDTLLGALVGGLLGARVVHVWLNQVYFAEHQSEIFDFRAGGLDWHGALLGALLGGTVVARLRRVAIPALLDGFALAMPLLAMALWRACIDANCGYGLEVRTLADYPAWLVAESPDIYGDIAPRLNLPPLGIALGLLVLAVIGALALARRLEGRRLWVALLIYSLGMALLGFFRAEYAPLWFGRRADQILDLAVMLFAVLMLALATFSRRRGPRRFAA